jgi:hypothetical protein
VGVRIAGEPLAVPDAGHRMEGGHAGPADGNGRQGRNVLALADAVETAGPLGGATVGMFGSAPAAITIRIASMSLA